MNRAVELWLVAPEAIETADAASRRCLSPSERARWHSLRFERSRQLYGAAHVFLRHVLCLYQNNDPADWRFEGGPLERPELVQPRTPPAECLRFSLSHTEGLIAVAVARGWRVGVDVEHARADLDLDLLAPSLLTPSECAWFDRLQPALRGPAFLTLWTLKESLLKACGVGLAEDLRSIALLDSLVKPRIVISRSRHLAGVYPTWNVALGQARGGHAIALAAQGRLSLVDGQPADRRRLAVFDLREPTVAPQGEPLDHALLLPVKTVTPVPQRSSTIV